MELERSFGGYRIGSNIPIDKGAVWENVARVSRWGAPVIELNTNAFNLGQQALDAIKQQAKANNLVYTWHIPPSQQEAGELAVPNNPAQNEFAKRVMEQSIKSAGEVGAKHITFHATYAPRPEPGYAYIYDAQKGQIAPHKIPDGLTQDEAVRLLNESSKAQFRNQLNNMESQKKLVDNLEITAKLVSRSVSDDNAFLMAGLVSQVSRHSEMVGLQPDNYNEWMRIQNKALRNESLNDSEKRVVKDYAGRVINSLSDYKTIFESNLRQLSQFKDKDLIRDGELVMRENVAKNIAGVNTDVLKSAISKGMTLGLENLPGNQLFSTPDELNDVRKRTIDELSKKGIKREDAERLIGFTFDIAHANTTRYFEIGGKRFDLSPSQFIEKLGGNVKHVHATDNLGAVDGHLPLGQGETGKEEFERVKEALRRNGFSGTSIFELGGSQLPVLYTSSMEWIDKGNYFVGGVPTSSIWGPSYLEAGMTDPLMLERDKGYFYESFGDVF